MDVDGIIKKFRYTLRMNFQTFDDLVHVGKCGRLIV